MQTARTVLAIVCVAGVAVLAGARVLPAEPVALAGGVPALRIPDTGAAGLESALR